MSNTATLSLRLDDYDLADFLRIAASFGRRRFGYVVTPNVDHLLRYWEDLSFRELYAQADYVLLDSRVLAQMLGLVRKGRPRVCTGSDLTAGLFNEVIAPDDDIVVVGGRVCQTQALARRYRLRSLAHVNPPMGFAYDEASLETTLRFIEAHSPYRYCFLAVGSPQQEIVAARLKQRGVARGLTLCCGASINFLTGMERRAPRWMQNLSLEWLYRLAKDPRRLARRYLLRGPRIVRLLPSLQLDLRHELPR
jgi:exopolysaccharide biosynthesis WecB/TagA/CpsF family protein